MSIIITEEDLCKKHAKKCAKICQFSSLPSKWFQAVNDPNTKIDSKPHICAYNYNTRTGFRDHKKTWGSSVLSSTLLRTENIAEDERFYKAISGLDDKTGQETIEHGNASPRKCEFKPLCLDEFSRCSTIFEGGRLKYLW